MLFTTELVNIIVNFDIDDVQGTNRVLSMNIVINSAKQWITRLVYSV